MGRQHGQPSQPPGRAHYSQSNEAYNIEIVRLIFWAKIALSLAQ